MNFKVFLGAVMALFIGILIVVYIITKQAHPILLDEHGRPIEASDSHH
jgi:hypothetical protein